MFAQQQIARNTQFELYDVSGVDSRTGRNYLVCSRGLVSIEVPLAKDVSPSQMVLGEKVAVLIDLDYHTGLGIGVVSREGKIIADNTQVLNVNYSPQLPHWARERIRTQLQKGPERSLFDKVA